MKEWTLIHWIVGALVLIGTAAWLGSIVMIDMSGHGSKGTATPDRAYNSATLTFNLTNHRGQPVSAESYRGKWLLVFFGFTQCSDICPTGLKTMIRAIDDLEGNTSTVQALFISIDPQRDTPEVLSAYLANYDPRIIGLTGPAAGIEAAARSIGAFSELIGQTPSMDESTLARNPYIYLVDPAGRLIRSFRYNDSPAELIEELEWRIRGT